MDETQIARIITHWANCSYILISRQNWHSGGKSAL